jgi:GT2 family glycosyltransferase
VTTGDGVRKTISVVIPTYGRDAVLVESIAYLLALRSRADEIVIVDQSERHDDATQAALTSMHACGDVRWIRLERPSITHAMNVGLVAAHGDIVLFVDDDIIPRGELVESHRQVHSSAAIPACERQLLAGRVLQPWHVDGSRPPDRLASDEPGIVDEFIGCNFSVDRIWAIGIGGFDERFVRVAYRYEAEFGARAQRQGARIRFVPEACIHHLRAERGGTRSYGDHLRTAQPAHAVGLYYYLLRARPRGWWLDLVFKPIRAFTTRFHLRHPWWIPAVLVAQVGGLAWALLLFARGPALIGRGSAVRP